MAIIRAVLGYWPKYQADSCHQSVHNARPVIVRRLDMPGNIFTPSLLHAEAEVQVKLAIDDGPGLGLGIRRCSL